MTDAPAERRLNPFTKSSQGGRVLSALQLPIFLAHTPRGVGILTTTGRRTGKPRRKCLRAIRNGARVYLVMLGPAMLGVEREQAIAAWLHNIRADPKVHIRLSDGTHFGTAREIVDEEELATARVSYTETVNPFDYAECVFHTPGQASRPKIVALHSRWFDTGAPIVIDLT
ncbi:nitroreductase/quinone reductase family protein [Antrihabitans cavernicola]|uniref:nitroreductase/quinone reductase family protein n=1 Tax=Antrihabitans cavernicola TaxID=2495913 RepID=UPI0016599A58|nr:nitroreductase/quinone reductase family protein [Spelaeibacter cavernicola]